MSAGRRASLVATCDQWARAHHTGTAVLGDRAVTLAWEEPTADVAADPADGRARGLAVDRLCRLYRVRRTTVERVALGPLTDGLHVGGLEPPETWLEGLVDGSGIGVDDDDRVYVADRGRRTVTVLDLWSRRVLRTVHLAGRPVGLAVADRTAVVVTESPDRIVAFTVAGAPRGRALAGPSDGTPARMCVGPRGVPAVLWRRSDGTGLVSLEPLGGEDDALPGPLAVGGTPEIAGDGDDGLLLLGSPGGSDVVRRVRLVAGAWQPLPPLEARGHDGRGLVVSHGWTLFWTAKGPRQAITARVTYATTGQVVTYGLDAGVARARWGRLFLTACVPTGTHVLVGAVTTDDDELPSLTATAPVSSACPPPDTPSPPALPSSLQDAATLRRPHRRRDPSTPWWRLPADSDDEVLEAPVAAAPGRYLWVTVELRGDSRHAPVLRELRVEQEAQRLTGMLPAVFGELQRATGDETPGFLDGYLAMVDGLLHDLDVRAAARHVLLDPHSTPAEALPWLAGFLGLVLDERWAESARRQLVAEIAQLYRRRGTVGALSRYLALFLAGDDAQRLARDGGLPQPVIVEHHRLRGLGSLVGEDGTSRGVLGAGVRVGGELAPPGTAVVGGEATVGSAAGIDGPAAELAPGGCVPEPDERAHRFTVLLPRSLGSTEEAAVRHLLDTERPAHTVYDLCTVDAGIRVGRGAYVGLSTMVGPTGGFTPLLTGAGGLGTTGVLGGGAGGVPVSGATPLGTGRLT